ncbi:MAG: class IV adenylate cyclase [Chloracidobacterium sp.]|nr:class IV adenylate cyclase [Chloracidobacterium sp.]
MGIEIEKKYRLDKKLLVDLTARLVTMGAEFKSEVFEENYLHRGGVLDERAAVLRLRKVGSDTLLTYKERISYDSDIKHRIEYETHVTDVDAMEKIIQSLGYKLSIVYEKHRKTFHFLDVEVVLDELPFGYYMEIEGEVEEIEAAEKALDITALEPEPRGYPRLAAKYGKCIDGVWEARFEKTTSA